MQKKTPEDISKTFMIWKIYLQKFTSWILTRTFKAWFVQNYFAAFDLLSCSCLFLKIHVFACSKRALFQPFYSKNFSRIGILFLICYNNRVIMNRMKRMMAWWRHPTLSTFKINDIKNLIRYSVNGHEIIGRYSGFNKLS